MTSTKETSYAYGQSYQESQARKFRLRENNHWKDRIFLALSLTDRYLKPILNGSNGIVAVDVGCSIGTFAIEFAKKGYKSFGIDFDSEALRMARELAQQEGGVVPEFILGDVSAWSASLPSIDVAVCFDIFEHLHDDEIGALLYSLRTKMSPMGGLVFHTFPTEYTFIFSRRPLRLLLLGLKCLPRPLFERLLRSLAKAIDIVLLMVSGHDQRERIKKHSHCNPLTLPRIRDLFERAGWTFLALESNNSHPDGRLAAGKFDAHPIAHSSIFGVAVKKVTD